MNNSFDMYSWRRKYVHLAETDKQLDKLEEQIKSRLDYIQDWANAEGLDLQNLDYSFKPSGFTGVLDNQEVFFEPYGEVFNVYSLHNGEKGEQLYKSIPFDLGGYFRARQSSKPRFESKDINFPEKFEPGSVLSYLAHNLQYVWSMGRNNNSIDYDDFAESLYHDITERFMTESDKTAFIKTKSGDEKAIDYEKDSELTKMKDNTDIDSIETATGKKLKEEEDYNWNGLSEIGNVAGLYEYFYNDEDDD